MQVVRLFHTHFPEDERRSNYLLLLKRQYLHQMNFIVYIIMRFSCDCNCKLYTFSVIISKPALSMSLKYSSLFRLTNCSSTQSITMRSYSTKNLLWTNVYCLHDQLYYFVVQFMKIQIQYRQTPWTLDPLQYFQTSCFFYFFDNHNCAK